MLWTLLVKDLRRARHNPWPYLINLALPLCITALIGLVFGPSTKGGGLGPIKVAVVDDDDSVLGSLLRGAMNQGDFKKHLETRFLEREEALKQINDNKISAVLIIPKGFTRSYLSGDGPVAFELIKNPAQSFYPAILEELLQLRLIRAIVAMNSYLFELGSRSNEPINEVELRALAKAENLASLKAQFAGRNPTPSGFNQSLPGTLVQFLMMNLMIFGGASVAGERAEGVLRRLAVYPIRRWELVIGKVYGRFLLGGVQIIFFLLLGQFIFKVILGQNLFAILLTLGLYAWVIESGRSHGLNEPVPYVALTFARQSEEATLKTTRVCHALVRSSFSSCFQSSDPGAGPS